MIALSKCLAALALLCGFTVAAWLRFDRNALLPGWIVAAFSLAAILAGALIKARGLPPIVLPPEVEQLGNQPELTSEEGARLTNALRAWHDANQRAAWHEVSRRGPWMLIARRAAFFYFWLALFVLLVVPPALIRGFLSPLPRFLAALLPVAAVAIVLAVPLGLHDWRRARRNAGTAR